MNEELFIKQIELFTKKPFPNISNLHLMFLKDTIRTFSSAKKDSVLLKSLLTPQESFEWILDNWISSARIWLELPDTGSVLNFGGFQLPQTESERLILLSQLIELRNQCLL